MPKPYSRLKKFWSSNTVTEPSEFVCYMLSIIYVTERSRWRSGDVRLCGGLNNTQLNHELTILVSSCIKLHPYAVSRPKFVPKENGRSES